VNAARYHGSAAAKRRGPQGSWLVRRAPPTRWVTQHLACFASRSTPKLRVEFRGATVTSDAGLLLPRELDERLGLSALIERHLTDPRTGRNRQFPLADLFRQSVYSRLAGYEDTNDAERLAADPTVRMLVSRERREISVALTSTLHWFETDVLAEERNYQDSLASIRTWGSMRRPAFSRGG
jgi:hypothetical protein